MHFRFHGELNDFLPPSRRGIQFDQTAGPTDTIKHVIESIGVPHTEIGRIAVNGVSRSLSEQLDPGACVDVFPHELPVQMNSHGFVVDGHLGRLAAYLRMLGFDTCYDRFADDARLAAVSSSEHRLLLTRDVGLLKRREIEEGYCVRSDKPREQLREITKRFTLYSHFAPFERCMHCNSRLEAVSKAEVDGLLPPHTRETKNEFSRCPNCEKIYWRISHRRAFQSSGR